MGKTWADPVLGTLDPHFWYNHDHYDDDNYGDEIDDGDGDYIDDIDGHNEICRSTHRCTGLS